MTHLTLDPIIPWALWVPLAIAAAGLLGCYAAACRRRLPRGHWLVTALMSLVVVWPLALLLNPVWWEQDRWPIWGGALLLWTATWSLRRRRGLV